MTERNTSTFVAPLVSRLPDLCRSLDGCRIATVVLLVALSLLNASPALAQSRDWHTGLNLRSDFGTHPIRLDGGVRFRRVDLIAVVDPMVLLDGQHDLDLLAAPLLAPGWSMLAGWRTSSIGINGGIQWQEKSVIGMMARPPSFVQGHLRAQFGGELAVLWVKHGAGLPTETLSFASPRHYLDLINFGLFVRFEYVSSPF